MIERPDAHLDPETIAALVDCTLDPAARAAAEAHLAGCADCREVWVETSEILSDVTATAKPKPRRSWIYGAVGLAAVAAIVVMVLSPQIFNRGDRPELRELVAAVGEDRRIEGRLTGGFKWGPVPSASRSGESPAVPADIESSAAALRLSAERNPTSEAVAGAGTAALVMGRLDQAITSLEEATALDPANASAWSDLAAAYLARSAYPNRATDVPKAIDAVAKALELKPNLLEARFNRALALSYAGLRPEAIAAWREYVAAETDPRWKAEGQRRLEALTAPREASDLQAPRERLFDVLLAEWAKRHVASPSATLTDDVRAAERLVSTPDDQLARDVVKSLDESLSRNPARAAALAAAHLEYAHAREAYRRDDFEAADAPLRRSAASFRAQAHPMSFQADVYVALLDYRRQSLVEAERRLTALREEVAARRYGSTAGRIDWTLGLIAALDGRRREALRHYETARDALSASGESANTAFVDGLMATSYDRIGNPARSWEARLRALRGSEREGVLLAAAESATNVGWLHAAAAFQQAAVARTRTSGRLTGIVDGLRLLATTHARLGFLARASDSLREANEIAASRSGAAWNRVRAELDLTMLELGAMGVTLPLANPGAAAVAFFDAPQTASRMPAIRLARARWLRRSGDMGAARAELEAGLALHQALRRNSPGGDSALAFNESARGLVEEIARIDAGVNAPGRAYALLEDTRAADLPNVAHHAPAMPRGATALSYLVTSEETFIWALHEGALRFARVPFGAAKLRQLIRDVTPPHWRNETAVELRRALIEPIAAVLESEQPLIVVPDGPLHALSFAALMSPAGRYLVEDHPIVYAPSVKAWDLLSATMQRTRPPTEIAAIGDPAFDVAAFPGLPRLPYAREEAQEVARGYSIARTPTSIDDIRTEVLQGSAHVLHFAGHVLINDLVANESRLVLGAEGVSAHEIRRHTSPSRQLVVLMACQSASGFPTSEGPLGLARAFLGAGAPSVVATLWPVVDLESKQLSAELHRAYRASGDAPRALRTSQLAMLRSGRPEFAAPAAWAGIIAIGGSKLTSAGESK